MSPSSLVVIDANVLVAAMVPSDSAHEDATAYLDSVESPWYVPVMALAEVVHLVEKRVGHHAELKVLDLITEGEILPLNVDHWEEIGIVANKYAKNKLGTVDASVVIAAEQIGTICIATMDTRLHMVTTEKSQYFDFVNPTAL